MEKNAVEVWENCLKVIKDNINYQSFKTWFLPIKPVKIKEQVLTIQVPSQFFYEWLEEHYIGLLKKTVKKNLALRAGWNIVLLLTILIRNLVLIQLMFLQVKRKQLLIPLYPCLLI